MTAKDLAQNVTIQLLSRLAMIGTPLLMSVLAWLTSAWLNAEFRVPITKLQVQMESTADIVQRHTLELSGAEREVDDVQEDFKALQSDIYRKQEVLENKLDGVNTQLNAVSRDLKALIDVLADREKRGPAR